MAQYSWRIRCACALLQGWCIGHLLEHHVISCAQAMGPSMRPAINDDGPYARDVVLIDRLSVYFSLLKHGDVIMCHSMRDPKTKILKRICGMEGDRVEMCVDGETKFIRVPRGSVWLLGDNAEMSVDSRTYGPVPYGMIIGKVAMKLCPFGLL